MRVVYDWLLPSLLPDGSWCVRDGGGAYDGFFDGVIDPFVDGGGGAFIHRAKNHGRPASH